MMAITTSNSTSVNAKRVRRSERELTMNLPKQKVDCAQARRRAEQGTGGRECLSANSGVNEGPRTVKRGKPQSPGDSGQFLLAAKKLPAMDAGLRCVRYIVCCVELPQRQ
jgi:hypothetical protein